MGTQEIALEEARLLAARRLTEEGQFDEAVAMTANLSGKTRKLNWDEPRVEHGRLGPGHGGKAHGWRCTGRDAQGYGSQRRAAVDDH